jgi:muramoyltetrapeptide carboxypeptidase
LKSGDQLTTSSFIDVALEGQSVLMEQVDYFDPNLPPTSGLITGGNLSIICSTLGTPMEIDTKGKMLFLEEINEEPYQIDRLLMQLLYAGKLDDCNGIMLGDFKGPDQEGIFHTIKKILEPLGKPVAYRIPAGHTIPNVTIPLGVHCQLVPKERCILIH